MPRDQTTDQDVEILVDGAPVSIVNPLPCIAIAGGAGPSGRGQTADLDVEVLLNGHKVTSANPLPVQLVAGGTAVVTPGAGSGSFTAGSLLFADGTGAINEDNPNAFYDDTNDALIVGPRGTYAPTTGGLHAVSTGTGGVFGYQASIDTVGARFAARKSRGTPSSPATIVTGDVLLNLTSEGHDGTNFLQVGAIQVTSLGVIAATRIGTRMDFFTATSAVPSVLTNVARLDNVGNLHVMGRMIVGETVITSTSPGAALHVSGPSVSPTLILERTLTSTGKWSLQVSDNSMLWMDMAANAGAGYQRMLITANGGVGFGGNGAPVTAGFTDRQGVGASGRGVLSIGTLTSVGTQSYLEIIGGTADGLSANNGEIDFFAATNTVRTTVPLAKITGTTSSVSATANDRAGSLRFFTKQDNTATITEVVRMDRDTQYLWVSPAADNTTSAFGVAWGLSRDTAAWRGAQGRLDFGTAQSIAGSATARVFGLNYPAVTHSFTGGTAQTGSYAGVQLNPSTLTNVTTAGTLADAATLTITGAPIAGTNMTITRAMALLLQTGADTNNGLAIRRNSSTQTAGLLEFQSDTGTSVLSRVSSSGRFQIPDGTVGSPGTNFIGDNDNGFYRIGTDEFASAAGGVKHETWKNNAGTLEMGFFGVAAAARPAAYTQTYATTTRTHSNPVATVLTSNGVSANNALVDVDTTGVADSAKINANFDDVADEINNLITDMANIKQLVNSVIDDDQTLGLKQ